MILYTILQRKTLTHLQQKVCSAKITLIYWLWLWSSVFCLYFQEVSLSIDHRLRRAVLHPSLVLTDNDQRALSPVGDSFMDVNDLIQKFAGENGESGNAFAETVLANIGEDESGECPICLDVMENPTIVPECLHRWQVLLLPTHDVSHGALVVRIV